LPSALSPPLAVAAVALILVVDALIAAVEPAVVPLGLLDWSAHVATAALVLTALGVPLGGPVGRAALVASVLIDLDHLPGYLDGTLLQRDRPFTHSLLTVAALALLAAARSRGAAGRVLTGAAAGVSLHVLRDVATGPGIAPLAPLTAETVRVPGWTYVLTLLIALACIVARRHTVRPGPAGDGAGR
jgi:inner membrane protein